MAASCSTDPQVFINFRGSDMREGFLGFLATSLRKANIKVFTDMYEKIGTDLENLLVGILESRIAIAIFSENYTGSTMCLDELAKIKECMDQRGLIAVPIFYKIEPSMVKNLEGRFGDAFRALKRNHRHEPLRIQKWEEALTSISRMLGRRLSENSYGSIEGFIKMIVKAVKRALWHISMKENLSREANIQVALMVTARQLEITHSEISEQWTWSSIYEEPKKEYEVVFVVKLEDTASGWECPVYLKLKLEEQDCSASREVKAVNLTNYIGYGWVNIRAGVFVAPPKNAVATGTVTMYQYVTDDRKGGLVVKGVAIRPIN